MEEDLAIEGDGGMEGGGGAWEERAGDGEDGANDVAGESVAAELRLRDVRTENLMTDPPGILFELSTMRHNER